MLDATSTLETLFGDDNVLDVKTIEFDQDGRSENQSDINPNAFAELDLISSSMRGEYLNRDLEIELGNAWRLDGDIDAKNRLVKSHLRLAAKMARKMKRDGVSYNDLMQEAALGLMKAADKFDPELGWRFATYARWWIQASLQEAVMRDSTTVRMKGSSTNRTAFFSMSWIEGNAETVLRRSGIEPTQDQILREAARMMGLEYERFLEIRSTLPNGTSLNEKIGNDAQETDLEKIDLLTCPKPNPEQLVIEEDCRANAANLIAEAMSKLSDREITIIRKRAMSLDPLTLEDLSQEFGVTRERVRQLEASGLAKLRAELAKNGFENISDILQNP